ncbi:MAG: Bug family tripartite tricarboxylate transporter substrate binding protein [Hyphomicrobiaceae bacterium]|jgi:tripartite-type tricarboxylate transporter receptor subunit TctC
MHRRKFLGLAGATLATGLSSKAWAQAQSWPDRTVRLILPYAPGGATDAIGRPWAEKLTQAFGQQFVIENRGGAGGMIGAEAAAKSPPDGYTLFLTPNAPLSVLPSLRKTPYDPVKSFEPVGRVGDVVNGFVIHPSLGVKTFKEMIEYAKKNPGKLAYGSSGNGTANHLRLEMIKYKLGLDILHVPYRGGADTLNDVLPGTVHMMNEPVSLPHVKAGKLILLAINGPARHPDFPDVPTLTELGVTGADVPIWFSIFAPAGTPKDIIAKLNAKMLEIAKTDDMKAKLRAVNAFVPLQTPEEMAKDLAADIKANAELIKAANIKIE